MSKIFIVEDCTKCPNFIPCTSPKDFRVGCKKLGDLGSPLNLIGGGIPIDCPLNDYEEPKTGHWVEKEFCGGEAEVYYINDLRYHTVRVGCSKC